MPANGKLKQPSRIVKAPHLALIGTVASNYWQIAYLNERIASVEASIANAEKVLELVEVKYQAGAVSALDKVQAQQTIASQKAQLTQLQQQRTEARNALAILFDQAPENKLPELQHLPSGSLPNVAAGLPASILAQRPDLQAAELRLKKYLASIDTTRASYYPSFTLTGSLGTSSTSLIEVIKNPYAALGAGLTLPFIQWNTMKLNVEISKTDYEEAVVNFRQTLYSALSDVENALSARTNYAEEVKQTEESLALARKAEELVEIRYRSGATALQSWLDAQESRRDAERALAVVRLNAAQKQYDSLSGTWWGYADAEDLGIRLCPKLSDLIRVKLPLIIPVWFRLRQLRYCEISRKRNIMRYIANIDGRSKTHGEKNGRERHSRRGERQGYGRPRRIHQGDNPQNLQQPGNKRIVAQCIRVSEGACPPRSVGPLHHRQATGGDPAH